MFFTMQEILPRFLIDAYQHIGISVKRFSHNGMLTIIIIAQKSQEHAT